MGELRYRYFSSIEKRNVEWLWYPYIPYGKITVLQGDPGEGKSTFILNVAALLTRGQDMPDGYSVAEPQTVIYQCKEDNMADTIKPRLLAAHADCNRIAYIVDDNDSLTLDDSRLNDVIEQTGAKLFILDPMQAFLTQDGDLQSIGRIRGALSKLATIADRQRCAVVLVGHMNKANGNKALYRGLGSIDIVAIARSVLMICRDHSNKQVRYMLPIKSSLAPEGATIGFSLDAENGFQWIGPCDYDFESIEITSDASKREVCNKYILELLDERDLLSSEVFHKMNQLGISRRTVQTAKSELPIQAYRKGGAWYWHYNADRSSEVTDDE